METCKPLVRKDLVIRLRSIVEQEVKSEVSKSKIIKAVDDLVRSGLPDQEEFLRAVEAKSQLVRETGQYSLFDDVLELCDEEDFLDPIIVEETTLPRKADPTLGIIGIGLSSVVMSEDTNYDSDEFRREFSDNEELVEFVPNEKLDEIPC